MSHFKMAVFLYFLFDFYSHITVHQPAMFLWIYRPMHRTDLFIVNSAGLEYTKKKLKLQIHVELCCIRVYIKKKRIK